MNHESSYSRDTLDEKFKGVDRQFEGQNRTLTAILEQTKKTNGRVTRMEKIMLVVGTALIILLIVSGSSFINFAKTLAGI